jgi:hypothetical protein
MQLTKALYATNLEATNLEAWRGLVRRIEQQGGASKEV